MEAAPEARKFKESEITFNLPEELKQEFEQQLERLKEKEEQANIQIRESLEKDKQLEEKRSSLKMKIPNLDNACRNCGKKSKRITNNPRNKQKRKQHVFVRNWRKHEKNWKL